jgi:hypothetical protein
MVGGQHLLTRHDMTTSEYREPFHLLATTSTASAATGERKRTRMIEQIAAGGPGRVYPLTETVAPATIGRWRSLAARRPDLLAEWDHDADENPDPYTIAPHSEKAWVGDVRRAATTGRPPPNSAAEAADARLAADGAGSKPPSPETSSRFPKHARSVPCAPSF